MEKGTGEIKAGLKMTHSFRHTNPIDRYKVAHGTKSLSGARCHMSAGLSCVMDDSKDGLPAGTLNVQPQRLLGAVLEHPIIHNFPSSANKTHISCCRL